MTLAIIVMEIMLVAYLLRDLAAVQYIDRQRAMFTSYVAPELPRARVRIALRCNMHPGL